VVYYRVLRSDLIATCKKSSSPWRAPKTQSAPHHVAPRLSPSSVALLGRPASTSAALSRRVRRAISVADTGLGYTLILAINESDFLVVQGIVLTVSILWCHQLLLRLHH